MSRARAKAERSAPERSSVVREAKLFMNGRSQAVRLPADCRFEGDSVYVKKWRGSVILLPKDNPWQPLLDSLGTFSPDFLETRVQPEVQDRDALEGLFDE